MTEDVTILYTFRNREPARIRQSIESLRSHGVTAKFMVVDYGSKPDVVSTLKTLAQELVIDLILMDAQGLPWNKCRAINHGVRNIQTTWVATSDIDMVYDCNPFEYCRSRMVSNSAFVMQAWFLDRKGNYRSAQFGGKEHPGGFVLQERRVFDELGGYDENIQYWGSEDWDWFNRMQTFGVNVSWLPESYKFYHIWHPVSTVSGRSPFTARYNTAASTLHNMFSPVISADWGRSLTKVDRPILFFIEQGICDLTLEFTTGSLIHDINKLVEALKTHQVVRCLLAPRNIKRKLQFFKPAIQVLVSWLVEASGLSMNDQVNENFDIMYAVLPVLKDAGVTDWFISDDFETIWFYRPQRDCS